MEQQLKQRLAGAIVLVSLAVIFIPVILEGPRDEWAPRNHTIPEPPDLGYSAPVELTLPAHADEPAAEQPGERTVTAETPPVVPAPPAMAKSDAPRPQAVTESASVKPVTAAPGMHGLTQGWYVQVSSFSKQDNARGERDRLRTAGLDAHLQAARTGKGTGYRVLIGPVTTRALAEKLRDKLAGERKMKGFIVEIGAPAG